MLAGFHAIDEHFRHAPFDANLPVLLGLIGVWYLNCFGAETQAILPYNHYLARFPAYLQQLDMESNGKSVTLAGEPVDLTTGPVVWGTPGTNGQHAYYQLIHQGTRLIPADFIGFVAAQPRGRLPPGPADGQLLRPDRGAGVRQDRRGGGSRGGAGRPRSPTAPSRATVPPTPSWPPSSRPASWANWLPPTSTRSLTQGVIWGINSFDQWGVELGKALAQKIVPQLTADGEPALDHDSSTNGLIRRYRAARRRYG